MNIIEISYSQLSLVALLTGFLAVATHSAKLGVTRQLLIASLRTIVQLALIGLVLEALFATRSFFWVALLMLLMLAVAGWEVDRRQTRRLSGAWSYLIGTGSLCLSSFTVTLLLLTLVIGPEPWYTPQYAIPLLGMMLGNSMTGVAIALDRLHQDAWRQRTTIEGRLLQGMSAEDAINPLRKEAMRAGLIPIINSMAAAGLVSLPGMMTGQILAGTPPELAVKYQIMVMLAIAACTGFGTLAGVLWSSRRLFDERDRLCLVRLRAS